MSFTCALSAEKACVPKPRRQRTIERSLSLEGMGLFTGQQTTLRLTPLEVDSGILFRRIDLPSSPPLLATLEYVQGTPRCTLLGHQGVCIQTVEHLLAALKACEIDNVLIEISGPEVPILDGSALPFIELIEKAGICSQNKDRALFELSSPVFWSHGDVHLIALPSSEYRVSYTLHYPHSALLGSQFHSVVVNEENFKTEIAPSRTFSLYEEIAPMLEKGLIKGSLANGIIIKEDVVMNPEGLRFPEEMVRHKILDLIGDLSLVAFPFVAHIIAIRSGHASNIAFARELQHRIKMENT